uniref:Uncharacterized protein n=1 Tax=Tetranychus urticae TaxID=32264 RepID=T1K7N5_TETUR
MYLCTQAISHLSVSLQCCKADFTRNEDFVGAFNETISAYNRLDILVNNAGNKEFIDSGYLDDS